MGLPLDTLRRVCVNEGVKESLTLDVVPERTPDGKWLPGRSPNPGGRVPASLVRAITAAVGDHGELAVDILWRIAQGREIPVRDAQGREVVDAEGRVSLARVPSLELQAGVAKWLLERAFGKAQANVVVSAGDSLPRLDLSKLTREQLIQFRELVSLTLPPGGKP